VYSEVWPPNTPIEKVRERNPVGVILSGGPKSVSDATAPKCDPAIYTLGTPVLGICYGMQLMADQLGGQVAPAPSREFGHAQVSVTGQGAPAALFNDVPTELRVWASHGDFVAAAPAGFSVVATSAARRSPRWRTPSARSARSSFIPKSSTPSTASRSCATSPTACALCTGDWTIASFVERRRGCAPGRRRADRLR
jgi:GMP synthase (glutamine-hydrolysing)